MLPRAFEGPGTVEGARSPSSVRAAWELSHRAMLTDELVQGELSEPLSSPQQVRAAFPEEVTLECLSRTCRRMHMN